MLSLLPMRKEEGSCSAVCSRWNDDLRLGFIAAIRSERYPLPGEDITLTVFFRSENRVENSHETAKFR